MSNKRPRLIIDRDDSRGSSAEVDSDKLSSNQAPSENEHDLVVAKTSLKRSWSQSLIKDSDIPLIDESSPFDISSLMDLGFDIGQMLEIGVDTSTVIQQGYSDTGLPTSTELGAAQSH